MKTALIIVTLFFSTSLLISKTIWVDRNIYSSDGNMNLGDIIIVNINDMSDMRFSINMNTRTSNDLTSNPDVTITGFLPKISSSKNMSFRDSATLSEKGQVNVSIAAKVTGKGDKGTYAINGSRTYSFNGVTNRISVSGSIDPYLIKGRSIDSAKIADFRVEIKGSMEGLEIKRPPLKEKETANTTLTEGEKQRLIMDYLEKMIRELSR